MASNTSSPVRVLLLTKSRGYRHDCIPTMVSAFGSFPVVVKHTEDSSQLSSLSDYDVIALGHNTGEYLTEEESISLRDFVENGGGVVGIHAATSGMKNDARYTKILGEVFNGHPPPQWIALEVENPKHYINGYESLPGTDSAPASAPICPINLKSGTEKQFLWFDELYSFRSHPRLAEGRTVLLSARDEDDLTDKSAGFPLSWCQTVGAGRVYYTALGHFDEAYQDSWFLGNLHRGIIWAAKRDT
ncbi:hypothetical protein V2G26_004006 [Clonostachys chloroleuca]|uniref:ThuA-like domain-containing protein n=1 Tax=Clonostachys chloroleuca TaxID=1926264 RepID=A0AA35M2W8_9HYPO|nr:unnamed protein product [Clonostachys chloroleuca]